MRVLILGFGPFPGAPRNPSAVLVKRLARRRRPALAAIIRTTHVFATAYAAVDSELPKLLADKPDIVLMFGLAARRRQLCIETQARRGNAPFARLLAAARGSRMPARASRDAGRYVCNYSYWRALTSADYRGGPFVQFIHIPRVRFEPRRKRKQKYRVPTFGIVLAAAENLLIALIAARRQERSND
jgi:pyroglutamyl-peptidase